MKAFISDTHIRTYPLYDVYRTASERGGNHLKTFEGLSPGSQGQNLAVTVLHVPSLLDSGVDPWTHARKGEVWAALHHLWATLPIERVSLSRDTQWL